MTMEKLNDDFVNVSVRIRPLSSEASQPCIQLISKNPAILFHTDRQQTYNFDNIFSNDSDQENVYCDAVKPLISKVKDGFNCTVFAYGQTGTGKTYTMGTNPQTAKDKNAGFIPRTLSQFFSDDDDNSDMDIFVSFIEIYNEKVFDLLNNEDKNPLPVNGFNVHGVRKEKIYSFHEGMHFLKIGGKNRHTGETKQNANSSRSHAIFTIHCSIKYKNKNKNIASLNQLLWYLITESKRPASKLPPTDDAFRQHLKSDRSETSSKLNLVDLAGSESVKKTGNRGSTFHEGVNINKGLLCIGQVMTALSHNAIFIPYRQSVITSILHDSLNKKNYISLIACISSNAEDSIETAQTLEFSHRVKKIKNKPEVNHVISQYKQDNPTLFEKQSFNAVLTTGLTPFKRSINNIFQTPFPPKRLKHAPSVSNFQEVSGSSATLDSPKSISAISLSSMSNTDIVQQTLSSMLRRYMTAMETSLMDKLQTVIENTVKKMPAKSPRRGKENTPSFSWSTVQNEVSKLVRSEISQFTGKAVRATSSPIEDDIIFTNTRRILNYDSPNRKDQILHDNIEEDQNHFFEMPNVPLQKIQATNNIENTVKRRKSARLQRRYSDTVYNNSQNVSAAEKDILIPIKKSQNKLNKDSSYQSFEETILGVSKIVISPDIDDEIAFKVPNAPPPRRNVGKSVSNTARRSSLRLQQKTILDYVTSEKNGKENEIQQSPVKRNIGMGLQSKREGLSEVSPNQLNIEPVRRSRRLSVRSTQEKDDKPMRLQNKQEDSTDISANRLNIEPVRRSRRLSIRNMHEKDNKLDKCVCNSLVNDTVIRTDKKKLTKQNKLLEKCHKENIDSPITVRSRQVLNTLNKGDRRDIEKLHSVGPKTADRILMFRQIKGAFKRISDLSEMPEWKEKRFKRFLAENFLRDDSE